MLITPKGLLQSVEMLASCMYIHGKSISEDQKKIISAALAKQNTSMSDFVAAFPIEMDTGKAISLFAEILGKKKIDEEVVLLFFGGRPHIDYAIKEAYLEGLVGEVAYPFVISHVGLPVTITDVIGSISGIYKNDDIEISLKNIINLADKFNLFRNVKVEKGERILVHYGVIVSSEINPNIWEEIHNFQRSEAEFKKACKNTKVIDCGKFTEIIRKMYKTKA